MITLIVSLIVAALCAKLADAMVPGHIPGGFLMAILFGVVGGWVGSFLMGNFGPHMAGVSLIPTICGSALTVFGFSALSKSAAARA